MLPRRRGTIAKRMSGGGRPCRSVEPLLTALLAEPIVADHHTFDVRAADGVLPRRRSCCLYYRTPVGGMCGDCPLTSRPRVADGAASVAGEPPRGRALVRPHGAESDATDQQSHTEVRRDP